MNTGIRVSATRILLAGVTLTLACAFSWVSVRQFTATVVAKSMDRQPLLEAVRLAPLNADYRNRLAYYYLYVDQESRSAADQFRVATELAPTSPNGWLGLAKTELNDGNTIAALSALDKASMLDPKGTSTLWEAGNLYLVIGQTKKGLNQFRIAADSDASLSLNVMETAWRATHNVDLVLDEGLPASTDWRKSFMLYLIARAQPDAALRAWDRLVELKQPLARDYTFMFIDYMMGRGRSNDAFHAWQSFVSRSSDRPTLDGVITNGGFEAPILNGGFDWRIGESEDVNVALDPNEIHSGSQSLALEIKSSRLIALPVWQLVKLEPNTRYRFRAFVKGDLTTASGVRFAISEEGKSRVVMTDEVIDEHKWKELSAEFTTGSEAAIGHIALMRERGETLVRGRLWIDDVSLTKEQ